MTALASSLLLLLSVLVSYFDTDAKIDFSLSAENKKKSFVGTIKTIQFAISIQIHNKFAMDGDNNPSVSSDGMISLSMQC